MKIDNDKKGFFTRLIRDKKGKSGSCCCSVELEEIPDGSGNDKDGKSSLHSTRSAKKGSCCGIIELEEIPDDSVEKIENKQ